MSGRVDYPRPGETWVSLDPRDNGLRVVVLGVENGYVRIQRYRKTTVSLSRFRRSYRRAPDDGMAA